ncbi:MAG: CusA/CzcA family heavy metal efflux RND transporter, partial [Verrucomicrobia bacterium]|nr:CusA/CzcA family heavy metal efflux RND transporter [Verrucomicrobiota bacterium]
MLSRIIEISMNQRPLVLAAAVALTVAGIWAALRLPLDAVPDITPPQVQINTGVNTLAPEEIEKQVTFPIESEMSGIPGMVELRSLSKSGLSQVTMLFEEGTDLHRARQIVSERLQQLSGELPEGITPQLAPLATGLGEIFYYSVDYKKGATNRPSSRREQLMQLKLIQDFQIKPLLRQTHGIAEVNTSGGYEKTWVVQPDPQRLLNAGLTVPDLASAILENTRNAGGGWVELGGEQVTIRANSRITRPAQIGEILLKHPGSGQPLRVRDVARIEVGSAFRTGASTENGEEAVVGSAIMMAGGNSRITAAAVREKLAAIQHKLSHEVEIRTLYDRSELVDHTIETVEKNLTEGALLVVVILFLFLGDFRAACIVALAIPLSMMFALLGMVELRVPGNLMSLGAVDFGLIIDGAVVMAENILRHISARQHALGRLLTPSERRSEVLASAREVVRPMFFGVLIITAVYVPVLALQGIEGRMFRPMAVVV